MRKLIQVLPLLLLTVSFFTSEAGAVIEVEDLEANIRFTSGDPFNSAIVDTGSGSPSDYELIACAVVDPNESNNFLPPSPGDWTTLDTGECGGSFSCIGGVWGRFTDSVDSEEITCSWTEPNFVFAGGSMRLSGVDADPIIAIACDTGTDSNEAIAPSVETEAGSFVARIYTFTPLTIPDLEPSTFISFGPEEIRFEGISLNTFQLIASNGIGEFFEEAGPTGTDSLVFVAPISWRACTIALRMGIPPVEPRPIPTLNEWGFMAVAVFMGAAGVWYLRRRQAQGT